MKRFAAVVVAVALCLIGAMSNAESDAAALQQLLQLLVENPDLLDRLQAMDENTNVPESNAETIFIIEYETDDNSVEVGEEVRVDEDYAFSITGISIQDNFMGTLSDISSKYLVLDIVVENFSLEPFDIKKNITAKMDYKERYAFEGSVYPSIATFLTAAWEAEENIHNFKLEIKDYAVTGSNKGQAATSIIVTQKTSIARHNTIGNIDELAMIFTVEFPNDGYFTGNRVKQYAIDINANMLHDINALYPEYYSLHRDGSPYMIRILEDAKYRIKFEIPNAAANDTSNINITLTFIGNEYTFGFAETTFLPSASGVTASGFAYGSVKPDASAPVFVYGSADLGATVSEFNCRTEQISSGNLADGAWVEALEDGSPAQKAGIGQWDIIVSVDGQRVLTEDQLTAILHSHKKGDTIVIQAIHFDFASAGMPVPIRERMNLMLATNDLPPFSYVDFVIHLE